MAKSVYTSIMSSPNPEELFSLTFASDDDIDEVMVSSIRKIVTNRKLECNNPNIEMIIKLFHRDESFNILFIENVKISDNCYMLGISQLKANNKFDRYDVNMNFSSNWKTFKKRMLNVIKREECPICYTFSTSSLCCPTCFKGICRNCVISQFQNMFHLKCALCNIDMSGMNEKQRNFIIKEMKITPIHIHKEIATEIVSAIFHT